MFRNRWLAHAQLPRDEQAADSVFDQVSITLWREMSFRVLEPFQDLQPPVIAHGLDGLCNCHFIN